AVVAVGGYGRREQFRHSDIDVMVLVAPGASEGVGTLLYPLWDAGLKVGHSVRTVEQAVAVSRENIETLTALLDARFVAGDRSLYDRFVEARRKLCAGALDTLERGLRERYEEMRR